jgi:hypothetical protein
MSEERSLWTKLAPQIEMLVPGVWAGALAVGLMACVAPKETKQWLDTLGTALVLPVVAFVGVVLFLVYRVIVGEWLLYPLRHALLGVCDWIWRRRQGAKHLSFTRLLASRNVPFFFRRYTYSAIRDAEGGPFTRSQRQHFDFLHATYHLFYVTGLELLAASLLTLAQPHQEGLKFAGIAFLVLAFLADFRQDVWECRLMEMKPERLDDTLKLLGWIPPLPAPKTSLTVEDTVHAPAREST